MKLTEYIEKNAINRTKFAQKCGLEYWNIYYILKGVKAPPLLSALKIERATNGEVSCKDLLPDDLLEEFNKEL